MAVRSLYREPETSDEIHFGALELHDVFRIYGEGAYETVALRGLDLRIEPGELVAVLGPSGSGKSTMLHLAAGLDHPSAGEVRALGRSLTALGEQELAAYRARDVAVVFQSGNLLPFLTAGENVALSVALARGDARDSVRDALAAFGLGGRMGDRAGVLSGGEQQRVAIAAAAAERHHGTRPRRGERGGRSRGTSEPPRPVREHRRRGDPLASSGRGRRPGRRDP